MRRSEFITLLVLHGSGLAALGARAAGSDAGDRTTERRYLASSDAASASGASISSAPVTI